MASPKGVLIKRFHCNPPSTLEILHVLRKTIKVSRFKVSSLYYYLHYPEEGGQVPEDVRTEIRFLYTDCPEEILANHPKLHVGIGEPGHTP